MASDDAEGLRRMYVDERMTPNEIADELGVHFSTIYRRLDRHDIERDPRIQFNTVGEGYEEVVTPEGERAYIHRLVAVAEYGFDAVVGNDIHHSNGVTWDNRPGNVEPISHGDHTVLHKRDAKFERDEFGNFA